MHKFKEQLTCITKDSPAQEVSQVREVLSTSREKEWKQQTRGGRARISRGGRLRPRSRPSLTSSEPPEVENDRKLNKKEMSENWRDLCGGGATGETHVDELLHLQLLHRRLDATAAPLQRGLNLLNSCSDGKKRY